jgi:oxygen-independent coproporphyrinogen-3 oxidase
MSRSLKKRSSQSLNPIKTEQMAGLYIHVPFCASKCPYCDFFSVADTDLVDAWCDGILRETGLYRELFSQFETVYLGGGTPSLLSDGQLGGLMEQLRGEVLIDAGAECTIEVNPDDVSAEKARFLRDLGFNRLSIGVQSFDDRILGLLKRRHTAAQACAAMDHAAAAGFPSISLDLMFGLPGQDWEAELAQAVGFEPGHLSCYQLTVKPGTPFYQLQQSGGLEIAPDETLIQLFMLTDAILENFGYAHYEVSNFARTPEHESRHNSRYWQHLAYLGLGPAAHSFDGHARWWNIDSLEEYCRPGADSPVAGREVLSEKQLRLERLMLGMRTHNGVAEQDISAGPDVVDRLETAGLITVRGGRVVPTARGMLFADRLPLVLG